MAQWNRVDGNEDSEYEPPAWAFPVFYFAGLLFVFAMVYVAWTNYGSSYAALSAAVAVAYIPIAPIAWRLGDKLRRYSMPNGYYSRDFMSAVRAKIFWTIGPQTIAVLLLCLGSLAVSVYVPHVRGGEKASSTPAEQMSGDQDRSRQPTNPVVDPMAGGSVSRHFSSVAHDDLSFSITRTSDGKYEVFSSTSDGCIGNVAGLDGSGLGPMGGVLRNTECKLSLTFTGKLLNVEATEACNEFAGHFCQFSGTYNED